MPDGLRVDGVMHAFGERLALDGVSCEVPAGRLTGLLGPNGAGKTTLMRILLGVLVPDSGRVWLDGRRLEDVHDRRGWGYMPQERGLYPAMAAGPQVVHFARLHGLSRGEATQRARDLLGELELGDRWDERTDRLSGGMQQRLQLATALAHVPEVIVLDEPFAGLDPVAVEQLSALLRRRAAAGCLVLFSSHQLDLVQDLCEDIVMVDHGRTVLAGSVSHLRAASGQRRLRLRLESPDRDWLRAFDGVRVVSDEADDLRLTVPPGVDPLRLLDAARSRGPVLDFGLELPTLSELFLAAVGGERAMQGVGR
ncbi:ATP-binding cassette domain-containing protein [Phycicoccus sp. M110.8]|uniref:ABC transporter ATP-binding protein n=1 Tax=Phycicoccus sp. M110.8 TaxID=3075433 RepID=UPI0028FDB437|nr:ATP-binding cassette domain-containing protein [Phycicoccus sp. M110.8]MDU0314656.1 ATP-binding cassette domain-containing protein [Phycicoccus sp. M110.8]